jgi:4-alpha-glucanotransferase
MKDIIAMADDLKEFVTLEDGFVYWWPSSQGTISSHDLRTLADELDRRNEAWQTQLNEYFGEK